MVTKTLNGYEHDFDLLKADGNRGYVKKITAGTGDNVERFVAIMLDAVADATANLTTTSTSSVTIGTGSKSFAMGAEVPYALSSWIIVGDTAAPDTNYMIGQVTAVSGTSLTINVPDGDHVNGSGTKTSWAISISGEKGEDGAAGDPLDHSSLTTLTDVADSDLIAFADVTDSDTVKDVTLSNLLKSRDKLGKRTIPFVSIVPASTNGCVQETLEMSSNGNCYIAFGFDQSTEQTGYISVPTPKSWNGGTVTFELTWTANSASTNSVVWEIAGVCTGDDDSLDVAYGSGVTVTDANKSTAYKNNTTAESSAITISNVAAEEFLSLRVRRKPTNVSDTLAATAYLLGGKIFFTTDAVNDE